MPERRVRLERQLRMTFPNRPEALAQILKTLRVTGGSLLGHLVYDLEGQSVGLFLCEKPDEAASALADAGLPTESETVVAVQTENDWGALSHLLKVLEEAHVQVGYTYAASATPDLCVILKTDDNDRAREALGRYLILADGARAPSS